MPSISAVYERIPVLSGSGTGETSLVAFNAALLAVGLGHYNVIRLSSVIPPGTDVDATGRTPAPAGAWGDRMYCVYAMRSATTVGEQAWAGVGWVRRRDGLGGLFVEHDGADEATVAAGIRASLTGLMAGGEDDFTAPDFVINGVTCTGQPVCSLVIAPYESASWMGSR
ncbi:MAG TPA: pyruvoyl-dependent arginine decarboxylase [Catenuloplanes sp.]|jgi:arginine decarboxylase